MEHSLIDYQGETLALILSVVLILGTVMMIGYVCGNLENAITFTIISMAPLFFLYFLFHSS
jgi:phosphate starvation-inducible membrane PsiE